VKSAAGRGTLGPASLTIDPAAGVRECRRPMPARARPRLLSPVLLLGAGSGEATCGILYLAGYLRRNGVQAFVRLHDDDETEDEVAGALAALVAHLRPRLVGVSLKWFHHLGRARHVVRVLRRLDPELTIVLGGDTASYFWRELLAWEAVDHVVVGDGERPLLGLCRGEADPPNCASRGPDGTPRRPPLRYVQGASSHEVHYSHFDQLFLSQLDRDSFSGWIAPGKGCGENCLYCAGGRGLQQASFGRARPFLRPEASVRRDHEEIRARVWQLRYDFSGGTAASLGRVWAGLDLARHATTYFLWGVPTGALLDTLARTFARAHLVLDIGCFSEAQRRQLMRQGLLKPCPSDRALLEAIERARRHPQLKLEVCGIAGLPFTSAHTLEQERRLVEQVLALGCAVSCQRLEVQPGALVTEHPERFGLRAEARSFDELLAWFSSEGAVGPGPGPVPMVRFADPALERRVERHARQLDDLVRAREAVAEPPVNGRTRLVTRLAATRQVELGAWLGPHRVPSGVAREPVTVLRGADGAGLACAPQLGAGRFDHPALLQGPEAAAILSVLAAFERPTTVAAALSELGAAGTLPLGVGHEVVERLTAGRFLGAGE
jgi:B12 binding domain